jgi:hypothetical protein
MKAKAKAKLRPIPMPPRIAWREFRICLAPALAFISAVAVGIHLWPSQPFGTRPAGLREAVTAPGTDPRIEALFACSAVVLVIAAFRFNAAANEAMLADGVFTNHAPQWARRK